jgi:hypothetical protein
VPEKGLARKNLLVLEASENEMAGRARKRTGRAEQICVGSAEAGSGISS